MRGLSVITSFTVVLCLWAVTAAVSLGARPATQETYVLRKINLTGGSTALLFRSPILGEGAAERYFVDLSPNRKRALMIRVIPRSVDHADQILYVADIQGRHGRAVTPAALASDPIGKWSPDGARVAYRTAGTAGTCGFGFWSAAANGEDSRPLGYGESFAWGADHNSFAIEGGCPPAYSAYRLVFTDRTGESHTIAHGWAIGLAVSPRGDRIAYEASDGTTQTWSLHIARTDGGGEIASIPDANSASWSPDGTRIAFIKGEPWQGAVAVAHANGRHVRIVVPQGHDREGRPVDPAWAPAWSPNGRLIAYMVNFRELDTVRPDGLGGRVVARPHRVDHFWWGTDSRHIYYDGVALL